MRLKTDNSDFLRFLKNEKFIEWKLLPTSELDTYWEKHLQEHPDDRRDIKQADNYLRKMNISSYKIPPEKKQEAIYKLKQSLNKYNRRRRTRVFIYATAASVTLLILSMLYIHKGINQYGMESIAPSDYIVGNELESEDILFISGNKTTSFQNNVDIQIDGNQTVQVKSEQDDTAAEIAIEQHTMNKLIVPYGKRSKIMLADGTQVWLNAGSTLEFPTTFEANSRIINLSGEMYIEVATDKNRSFYVHTSGYHVKVYGTKFNISTYSGAPSSVVLVEGSVSLQSAGKQELFLSPNEQACYSTSTESFNKRKVDVQNFISWKDGYLSFEDTPVNVALKQIERYYNLSFNYGDDVSLQGFTCTGKIILSDNLDNVMTALTLISGTKYKKENKLIYIYKD